MAPSLERFDVYISFNQQDADAVREIAGRLKEEGIRVWVFDWRIGGGAKWALEMKEALAPPGNNFGSERLLPEAHTDAGKGCADDGFISAP